MRRVLIVGAGFAGLACAYELFKMGCEVRVLEARGRVGGRVDSRADLIPGKVVEAGGELLGANHPTVIRYAAEFGLRFLDVEEPQAMRSRPVLLNGHKLTDSELADVDVQSKIAFESLTQMASLVDLARPWETPDAKSLDHVSLATWLRGVDIPARAKLMVEAYFTSNNSVSIDRQSLLGNLTQIRGGGLSKYWTDTESYRCHGGNQQFAVKLAEAIGSQHIHLNCPVTDIHVSRDQVLVTAGLSTQYAAEDVVLAVPPSTWSQIRIDPPLPASLLPQMGMALKCLSTMRGRFWEQTGLPPAAFAFSNANDAADIGDVWWGTENQSADDPREALVSFISGPAAQRWSVNHDDVRRPLYIRQMEAVQPGFAAAVEAIQFIDWIGDPWSRASYSFPAPGQITTQGPVLHAGLGRLHFAGEHTCYPFIGYMEGALNSGASLAQRLLAR